MNDDVCRFYWKKRKNLLQGRRNQIESGGTNLGKQKKQEKISFWLVPPVSLVAGSSYVFFFLIP